MNSVALKIHRRRYGGTAAHEARVHALVRDQTGLCPEIIELRETFLFDGHTCLAFEKHGLSLDDVLDQRPLTPLRVRHVIRQVLMALERLHRCGYAHTDVKTANILFDPRSGEARLADLGNAREQLRQGAQLGTREYTPPEVLIGAPLQPNLDLWSLGCSAFEMLARKPLFDPRATAGKKYLEFSTGKDGIAVPLAQKVLDDMASEEEEQFPPGAIIASKYKLRRVLGQGRFGTVWLAHQLTDDPLGCSCKAARIHKRGASSVSPAETERERRERAWRRAKGADDLLDLALNYEHVLLIARLCGPFPRAMVKSARYRSSYFENDGDLRFRPRVGPVSLRDRLRRCTPLRNAPLDLATDFLTRLLSLDPNVRPTAAAALAHPWLAGIKYS